MVSDVAYGGTYRFCTKVLSRFGVEFTFADTSDPKNRRGQPARQHTHDPDRDAGQPDDEADRHRRRIGDRASSRKIPHAVDNTFLTPYYQRPFELGADLIVHSTTKYFDGHNATVGGAVVSRTAEQDEAVRFIQTSAGTIMSPQVAWLTLQGCKTLSLRMDRQSDNAMAIARFLESHPKVDQVCYPGLESFRQHDLARRQADGFGAMLWFEVKGGVVAGKKLMDSIELWTLAENLGSAESLVTHPVTMTHAAVEEAERKRVGITDGLVRLSVGLEDAEDLIDALKVALDRV